MLDIPLIDWNGNEQIDYFDVARTLTMNDSNDNDVEDDDLKLRCCRNSASKMLDSIALHVT